MSACATKAVENILSGKRSTGEGKKIGLLCEDDRAFWQIWCGGVHRGTLTLKLQITEDAWGNLLYNGRPYNRNSWSWRPPKFIRLQGRTAKEQPDPLNSFPTDVIEREDGMKERIRRVCTCGGRLLYDPRTLDLYCEKCYLEPE